MSYKEISAATMWRSRGKTGSWRGWEATSRVQARERRRMTLGTRTVDLAWQWDGMEGSESKHFLDRIKKNYITGHLPPRNLH